MTSGIIKGVAEQKVKGLGALIKLGTAIGGLVEITTFTKKFIKKASTEINKIAKEAKQTQEKAIQ